MATKKLFDNPKQCCGCEACSQICPKGIIKMRSDKEGFFYPYIEDESLCINCGLCNKVCPLKKSLHKPYPIISNYGGYCIDEEIIQKCASGGFAYTLSTVFIKEGGVVYGVGYSDNNMMDVSYCRCESFEQLKQIRGSKYAHSRKYNVFKDVQNDLRNNNKVLFIGLPCEVAALYNFLGKKTENLYTVDLICHGPTSIGVHKAYINQLMNSLNKEGICDFSVRFKKNAWKPYYVYAEFSDGFNYIKKFEDTDYGTAFQQLKRPSCSVCHFKVYDKHFGMPADITIGDFHLANVGMKQYNHWGSSQISIHTSKGEFLLGKVKPFMRLYPISERMAVHYNTAFFRPTYVRWNRGIFSSLFSKKGLHFACTHWTVNFINKFVFIKRKCKSYIAYLIKKI